MHKGNSPNTSKRRLPTSAKVSLPEIQSFESSIKFGVSFITILFTSALLGYFLGTHLFGWSQSSALALSGLVSFFSILLEITLFILKEEKQKQFLAKKSK